MFLTRKQMETGLFCAFGCEHFAVDPKRLLVWPAIVMTGNTKLTISNPGRPAFWKLASTRVRWHLGQPIKVLCFAGHLQIRLGFEFRANIMRIRQAQIKIARNRRAKQLSKSKRPHHDFTASRQLDVLSTCSASTRNVASHPRCNGRSCKPHRR